MPTNTLRVLTLNMLGYDRYEERRALLRRGIEELAPDVMAIQEAGHEGKRPHQIEELLSGLGYHFDHQYDGVEFAKGRQADANAIVSRWPITRRELLLLPRTPRAGTYPNAALIATIHAPQPFGDFLFVCNKPTWHLFVERERELQAVAVIDAVERLAELKAFPTIIAGDFDAPPDRSSIRFFTGRQSLEGRSTQWLDCWEMANECASPADRDPSGGDTWDKANPLVGDVAEKWTRQRDHRRRIDYIFIGSPFFYKRPYRIDSCRVVLNKPTNGMYPSDHYGVFAEIAAV